MSEKNLSSALEGFVAEIEEVDGDPALTPKMWILVRKDLDITVPKFAAQVGHAVGTCLVVQYRRNPALVDAYLAAAQPKIVVGVDDVVHMEKVVSACKAVGIGACIAQDAGRTEFDCKTITVGAIGPCSRADLPTVARRLRLLKPRAEREASLLNFIED
jgi:peptidyl-tRNA hydrolase, PTH2 family